MNIQAPKISQLEIQSEKREQTFIKLIVGGLVSVVLLIVCGYVGLNLFHRWQERHLVRLAVAYLSGGDTRTAGLSARRAFQMNPDNVDAVRIIADIADREGDRAAVEWWRKLINLKQHQAKDVLAYARAALRVSDLGTTESALNSLDETEKQDAEYHAVAAELEETKKNQIDAEMHWQKASELQPDNTNYQFRLASARLEMHDPQKSKLARQTLDQLRTDPGQRIAATRALVLDGLAQHDDVERLKSLATELQNDHESIFSDRLLYLDVLREGHDPGFDEALRTIQADVQSHPDDVASLITWMSGNETAPGAIGFAKTLSPAVRDQWPVLPAIAATLVSLKDWASLEDIVRSTDWTPFNFLRHAYLARALRGKNQKFAAEQEWAAAQKDAFSQPPLLLMLARTTETWGWEAEEVELLWLLAKYDDTKLAALQTLYEHYGRTSDTVGLYRTLLRLVEVSPHDLALQNNLAQISLLLRTDVERAYKIAADVVEKQPSNEAYVSTYAFSLYTKGDIQGALRTMDQLTVNQLHDPPIAAYYGVILAAAGKPVKAQEYLLLAAQAQLLPEEKALVAKAQTSIK